MNTSQMLRDLIGRPLDALGYTEDQLDFARLNAHPGGHPNSPAWLLWHAAREVDAQVSSLSGAEQVWTSGGFQERFGLDAGEEDMGYGHTAEQAGAITVSEDQQGFELLKDYLQAALQHAQDYAAGLSEQDLGEVIDESWDPPVTRGSRLISVADDALQHVGQFSYVMGMVRVS